MILTTISIDLGDIPNRDFPDARESVLDTLREYAAVEAEREVEPGRFEFDLSIEGDDLWEAAANVLTDTLPNLTQYDIGVSASKGRYVNA